MRAIRASLATRLGSAAVGAVLVAGGGIATATAFGAAKSHSQASRANDRRDDDAGRQNREETQVSSGATGANDSATMMAVTTVRTQLNMAITGTSIVRMGHGDITMLKAVIRQRPSGFASLQTPAEPGWNRT